ncbi:hypothetical protein ACT6QH_03210 [Xanthobacter sp. TB0139]|uniref:hypothetical protein n=1 Tax=Xanthobacter sp. TB0139 TaxID=3459178 RepID=UPI00403A16DA
MATLVFILCLPFFAQVFHYLNELPPPYFLSKAWPILVLPFTFYALLRLDLPGQSLFLVLLAYVLGFTPLISVMQLGNWFSDAMITTVKAWPYTYYFALSGVLALLALPAQKVRKVFLGFGQGTFILFVLLWVLVPGSWYGSSPDEGKMLQYDVERGNRIYMATIFGMIYIFYLGRSFIETRKVIYLAGLIAAFLILLFIYKQRAAIGAVFLVTMFGMVTSLPARARRFAIGAGAVVGAGLLIAVMAKLGLFTGAGWANLGEKLGGSLSVRQNSSALAVSFLGTDVERWLFGVGATTRFGSVTLKDIFGYDQFFIADLGLLGTVFEYGLVGTFLILSVYVWAFLTINRNGRVDGDRFQIVLGDYVLYLLVTSPIYPLVFLPGELGVVLAVAIYVHRGVGRQHEPEGRKATRAGRVSLPWSRRKPA